MKKYLELMSDINKGSSSSPASNLWSSHPDKKTDLTQSVYEFFTFVLKAYDELSRVVIRLCEHDYLATSADWQKLVKGSNISSISCFSTLDPQCALVVILRNIATLKKFVYQQLKSKSNAYLPLDVLTPQITNLVESVTTLTSELFEGFVKNELDQLITKSLQTSQSDKNVRAPASRFQTQYKVSRSGHLILNHLVKVFNALHTIDPSSAQTLFPLALKSVTELMVQKYKKAHLISYTDVALLLNLLGSRLNSADRKALVVLQSSFPISQKEIEKSVQESDIFLNQNRFHFICFSS